ncbi:ParA family protein [Legionella sainthelensi]|uniref:Cyclic nucleotide-binding domain-containing protein n=1 Tax=Legionella sainthelensi TaxID=28087 RepID=A0A2H5FRU3_9GAMM|nr:ParA family protein [Legionella sainthelensi]AUH74288.1 ParA family protein [Legionella sainthelensi]
MDVSQIKICELSRITDINKTLISRYFKEAPSTHVTRVNERIVGLSPEGVTHFLEEHQLYYFNKGAVILSANLCGGVGKTTGIRSLSASARRIIHCKDPIIIVDTDSQGSLTSSMFGAPALDNELILIDFLEGKAKLENILTEMAGNVWFVKSNLNQVYLDKILTKPGDIKRAMLSFYQEIFNKFGNKAKIFQDHTPQLSNIFASSVCALSQLDKNLLRSIIIPMRSDNYAIDGAEKILNEINELQDTFHLHQDIDIHCYFSSIDKRISTTSEAIKRAKKKEAIINRLSPIVIRYCSEIPKSIQKSTNIYTSGKSNNAAEDFQDLLHFIFSFKDNEIL